MFSTCSGLSIGDTYLRLYETNGTQLAVNDDDHLCTISRIAIIYLVYKKYSWMCIVHFTHRLLWFFVVHKPFVYGHII